MRLKTFEAKSMNDALKQVKETLGDDAIIVSTREDAGGWVRITAAVENIPEKPMVQPAPAPAAPPMDEDDALAVISDTLLRHRVPAFVSDIIVDAASLAGNTDPQKMLARALAKVLKFERASNKPLLLAGPPGAGKTLMTAKLATEAVMAGKKPAIITTDIARAGGIEQLGAFLNILDLKLHQAEDAKSLQEVLMQVKGNSPIIIDTGGLNPFDPQEMKFMARLLAVTDMQSAMVLPAGIDAEESADMAQTFEILGIRKIIPTRLDFARRLGGILSAAVKANLAICEASHTPQVANGITYLTAETLAAFLLPQAAADAKTKRGRS